MCRKKLLITLILGGLGVPAAASTMPEGDTVPSVSAITTICNGTYPKAQDLVNGLTALGLRPVADAAFVTDYFGCWTMATFPLQPACSLRGFDLQAPTATSLAPTYWALEEHAGKVRKIYKANGTCQVYTVVEARNIICTRKKVKERPRHCLADEMRTLGQDGSDIISADLPASAVSIDPEAMEYQCQIDSAPRTAGGPLPACSSLPDGITDLP